MKRDMRPHDENPGPGSYDTLPEPMILANGSVMGKAVRQIEGGLNSIR